MMKTFLLVVRSAGAILLLTVALQIMDVIREDNRLGAYIRSTDDLVERALVLASNNTMPVDVLEDDLTMNTEVEISSSPPIVPSVGRHSTNVSESPNIASSLESSDTTSIDLVSSLQNNTLGIPNVTDISITTENTTSSSLGDPQSDKNQSFAVGKEVDTTRTVDEVPPNEIRDFEHQSGVVIATKVQGDQEYQIQDVKQSLCLLTAAYNDRVNYDIVVFTSHPWNDTDVEELKGIAAPAKVSVVMDSPPVADVVKGMSETGRQKMLDRCNVKSPDDFHWHTECDDGKLRYNWQAEFRAKHIWSLPVLAPYQYMLWIDSDGHSGAKWQQDPVATMIRNDLVLLFDNFPGGTSRDIETRNRIKKAFGEDAICGIALEDGHLVGIQSGRCQLQQVHGFFHITNLDFYRSAPVQKWVNELIGDDHFRRTFDDQIGITVPAAVLAPNRSWDMYSHDIKLKVVHNRFFDGKRGQLARGYRKYWENSGQSDFPEAWEKCSPYIKSNGR